MVFQVPRDTTLSVRIPSDLKTWLDETAAARGVTTTTLLIELIQRSKRVSQPSIELLRRDVERAERTLERVKAQIEKLETAKPPVRKDPELVKT